MTSIQNIKIKLDFNREKVIPRRKLLFAQKLKSLLDEYDTCLIIDITNIGSKQIAEMRKEFRGKARFLFGKNTLIRKVIRDYAKEYKNKELMKLIDLIKGNCGLVFTKNDINITRKELIKSKKQCAAKVNMIAPNDVFIPIGPTNLEPTKTKMLHEMDFETRINRGQIDITCEKHLIKKGNKIGASEAILLSQLNIKPFYYGIIVKSIYENGNIINDCTFMDMTSDDITCSFYNGIQQIAALCFSLSYPTICNVPHSILNAYKNTLGLSMQLQTYSFDGLETIKKALEDAVNNIQLQNEEEVAIININADNDTDNDTDSDVDDIFKNSSDEDSSSSDDESDSESDNDNNTSINTISQSNKPNVAK